MLKALIKRQIGDAYGDNGKIDCWPYLKVKMVNYVCFVAPRNLIS